MAWKKENNAYFADSFDRDSALCYTAEAICATDANNKLYDLGSGTLSFTINNASINNDVLTYATGGTGYDQGVATVSKSFTIDGIGQVSSKIEELQAQIDNLKKNLASNKSCIGLRPALATLKYKREVE